MKKSIVGMLVALLVCLTSVSLLAADSPFRTAQIAAMDLYSPKHDYAKAKVALEKILVDFPAETANNKAYIKWAIGNCLYNMEARDLAVAQVAYQRIITDCPTAEPGWLSRADYCVGLCLYYQDKLPEAQAAFQRSVNRTGSEAAVLATAQLYLGNSLKLQGKMAESQIAYMACVQNYVWELGASDEKSVIWQAFEKVSPKLLTTADYKAFLDNAIKATKATEENAKFLGRVKSELEKMK
jgi:TolA-binding protein